MKKMEVECHEEFEAVMAEVRRNNWRILSLQVGKTNSSWILTIDDTPPIPQPQELF